MSAERGRILIIDDEEIVRDSCLAILDGAGYEIDTAPDGNAGLERARARTPDLVLVDLMMPGISGFEVLEAMREVDPTIVTIVITGYSTVESAVEAMKKGAFDFLPKPFTPDEVRLIVQRGLERRRLVLEANRLRREKEMLQENFAAIISHELRSPLSAVQQNLFVLESELEGRMDAATAQRVERMKTRIDDLLKMISGWLRAVSVPVDSIRDDFVPVDVAVCVAKALESVQPQAVRKDITVVAEVAPGLPAVLGDEGSLTEALVNLAGNAVKYTHPGGRVTVAASAAGGSVLLSVADTGIGIASEELSAVFDAFYRAKSGAATESGAGIGLALTRRIVATHGGTLSVESEVGKGTTFSIRLPVHDAGAAGPAPEPTAASTRQTGDMR